MMRNSVLAGRAKHFTGLLSAFQRLTKANQCALLVYAGLFEK